MLESGSRKERNVKDAKHAGVNISFSLAFFATFLCALYVTWFLVYVRPRQFHLILVGEVGNFLNHFLYLILDCIVISGYSFHLQVIFTDHKARIVEESRMFQKHFQIEVRTYRTYF